MWLCQSRGRKRRNGKSYGEGGTMPPFSESVMCKWTAHVSFQCGGRLGGYREGILLSRRLMGKAGMKTHCATVYDLISHSEHRQPSDALARSSESLGLFFWEGSALSENSKYRVMRKTPCIKLYLSQIRHLVSVQVQVRPLPRFPLPRKPAHSKTKAWFCYIPVYVLWCIASGRHKRRSRLVRWGKCRDWNSHCGVSSPVLGT